MLVFSCLLIAVLAVTLFVLLVLKMDVALGETLLGSLGFNVTGGRAPGIGIFTYYHYPIWRAIVYNIYLEVTIVTFMYAVLVLTLKNYIHFTQLDKVVARLEYKAHKNKDKVNRYGWIGLFFFSMIPLPFTGPVLGSVIGYFLKFGLLRNFSAVLLGSGVAVVAYAFGFRYLEDHLHIFRYAFSLLFAIVFIYFSPSIYRFFKGLKASRDLRSNGE
ncbi:MAG: small multi-drug export protein [Fibrobacterota bacterium]